MSMNQRLLRAATFLVAALLVLAPGLLAVNAQQAAEPITVGEERSGQVSTLNIAPSFLYEAAEPQVISVVVQSASGEFAPALRVLTDDGTLVEDIPNPVAAPRLEAAVQLPQGARYILQVQSANGRPGNFTILVNEAEPLPEQLLPGDDLDVSVSPDDSLRRYVFESSEDTPLRLIVESDEPTPAVVTLTDEAGDELARFSLQLAGAELNIPQTTGRYLLTIFYNGTEPDNLRVALLPPEAPPSATATPQVTATAVATRIPLSPLPATGPCLVASFDGGAVNLRSGPSTSFSVLAQLRGNQTANVIGRLADTSWYQVNYNGVEAWVAAFVVRRGGECGNLPVVAGPNATPVPTATSGPTTADLTIGGMTVTPDRPLENTDFSVNVNVTNSGAGPASNVLVRIVFDSPGIVISLPSSEATIPSLPAGASITVNFVGIRANTGGDVRVTAIADPNNSVPETNEDNNSQQVRFTIVRDLADLVISALEVTTQPQSTVARVRVVVQNQGARRAGDFQVALTFSPGSVGAQTLNLAALDPGQTREQTIDVDLTAFGDYTVTATADPGNAIGESREDNNTATRSFTLQGPPPTEETPEATEPAQTQEAPA